MCWATLTLLRCAIVATVPGGFSYIFAQLLRLFSVLAKGIVLPGVTEPFMCVAKFGGMLADLVGHQALSAWKGPNTIRCCVRCANVIKRNKVMVKRTNRSWSNYICKNATKMNVAFGTSTPQTLFSFLYEKFLVLACGASTKSMSSKFACPLLCCSEQLVA